MVEGKQLPNRRNRRHVDRCWQFALALALAHVQADRRTFADAATLTDAITRSDDRTVRLQHVGANQHGFLAGFLPMGA
jgi:hypothetical protein